jgi:hypothetical protein
MSNLSVQIVPKVEELWCEARRLSGCGDERISCLEDIVNLSPSHARARALLGILLATRGGEENKRRALSLCRSAVELKPEDLPLRIALGRLADGEEKRGALHIALKFDPDNLEAMVLLITASQSFGAEEEDLYMRIKQKIEVSLGGGWGGGGRKWDEVHGGDSRRASSSNSPPPPTLRIPTSTTTTRLVLTSGARTCASAGITTRGSC